MLDLNQARPQLKYYDLEELRRRLCRNAEIWIPPLYRLARREGNDLRLANIQGGKPKKSGSCVIHLKGPHAGEWYDFTERQGGGPLELLRELWGITSRALYDEAAALVGQAADKQANPRRSSRNGQSHGHA